MTCSVALKRSQHEKQVDLTSHSISVTHALVGIWAVLCTICVFFKPQLLVVFLASATYGCLRLYIIPGISTKYFLHYREMSSIDQQTWLNTVISLIHSTISSGFFLACMFTYGNLFSIDPAFLIKGDDMLLVFTLAHSTGYFAYDLWDIMASGIYVKSPELIVHHAAVLTCYTAAIYKCIGILYLCWTLCVELNSIFLHARKLLQMNKHTWATSSAYRMSWRGLWLTCLITRFILFGAITVSVYQNTAAFPHIFFARFALTGMIFFTGLNSVLTYTLRIVYLKDLKRAAAAKQKQ